MHSVESTSSSFAWCKCGQGFSGANVEDRLQKHIDSPDGIGQDLIKLMGSK